MAQVTLKHVSKEFPGGVQAVRDVSLEIHEREFLVLLGPSGCGKTTLLRMIAGLESVTAGEIYIGGRLVNFVPPRDRDIAMVFQNYALYPHMDVTDNIVLGLRLHHTPREEIQRRLGEAAGLLRIGELLRRMPRQLSGGQQQRVSLGRAIVREPQVFLMDEPLSNLDARMRVHTRTELIKLHRRLETTIIYVTHDQSEAMTMATRIAVMRNGELQQCDTPLNIYRHPVNKYVAGFMGNPEMNFLKAQVARTGEDWQLRGPSLAIPLPRERADAIARHAGATVWLGIRPEALSLQPPGSAPCALPAAIDVVEPLGRSTLVYAVVDGETVVAEVAAESTPRVGERVDLAFDPRHAYVFDLQSERALW